jgi:hypothetical protein
VIVLDIGKFIGASAFHFASQPGVLRVISANPNPMIADEINDKSGVLGSRIDLESLRNLRVLDIAGAALAEFADEQHKIQLRVGVVGSTQEGTQQDLSEGATRVEVPAPEPSDDAALLAFIDGLHNKEGVRADLEAVFGKNPRALVILDDCRGSWGPFVQAGVVEFIERSEQKYHFRLFGDLSFGLATSSLGIVYADTGADEVEYSLAELSELFSERLEWLRLLRREDELIGIITDVRRELNQTRDELVETQARWAEIKERHSQLQERHSQLWESYSQLQKGHSQLQEHSSRLKERDRELKGELKQTRGELKQTRGELEQTRGELEQTRGELAEVEQHSSQLQERMSQLATHYSSRRYKLADTIADGALRVPGIQNLVGRKPD